MHSKIWIFEGCEKLKRGSLLGNEETHLVGDSTVFEIIYPNLETEVNFLKKNKLTFMSGLHRG